MTTPEAEVNYLRRALWILTRQQPQHRALVSDADMAAFDPERALLVTWRNDAQDGDVVYASLPADPYPPETLNQDRDPRLLAPPPAIEGPA